MRKLILTLIALAALAVLVPVISLTASAGGTYGTTYGDTRIAWKAPVKVATTANITLSAPQTIDGVGVVAEDEVLVKAQTTPAENGIYVVKAGAWQRRRDFVETTEKELGSAVYIQSGTVGANLTFVYTAANTWSDWVDISGAVPKDLFDAQTVLTATLDDTPVATTVAEGSLVGRTTGGNVGALTGAQVWAELTGDAAASVSMNSQGFTSMGPIAGATTIAASGTVTLGATTQGTIDLLEASGNGSDKVTLAAPAALTADRVITVPDADVTLADIALNTTHRSSDGSDHTFIDQDVTSGSSPTLDTTNLSGPLSGITTVDASGTCTLGATVQGTLHLLEASANGSDKVIFASPAALTADRTITIPDADVTLADIALNTTHRSSDGSDHTFIDQDVTSGSSPTLDGTNFTGVPDGALSANVFLADGTVAATGALNFGSQGVTAAGAIAGATISGIGFGLGVGGNPILTLGSVAGSSGTLRMYEQSGNGTDYVQFAAPAALTANRTITIPDANVDLTYLDQDVTSGSSPTLDGTNFTGVPDGALSANVFLADGTVAATGALDFGSQGVTNTGAVAGATTIAASGTVTLGATTQGTLHLLEASGNGTDYYSIASPAALSANRSLTLPDADVDLSALIAENTDGQIRIPIQTGLADGGTWTPSVTSGGLVSLTRTAADAPDSLWVDIPIPNRTTASKGIKPTGASCNYTIDTDDCADFRVEVWKVTQGADGAARTAAVLFGDQNEDYPDASHDTAAERCDSTTGPELHLVNVVDFGTPAYVGDGETLMLRIYADGDAGGAPEAAIVVTDCLLDYSETLIDF